jgi:pyrimidine deaminase RibD-like protein
MLARLRSGVMDRRAKDAFDDRALMERAIALARRCESELGKVSPKVGAVLAREGIVVGEAFRGELAPGDHAEFTLLEKEAHPRDTGGCDAVHHSRAVHGSQRAQARLC